jgi:hypothetical protein
MTRIILVVVETQEQWEDFHIPCKVQERTADFAISTLWNYRKVFREDFMNANLNTYDRVYWATGNKPTMAEFQKMSMAPCFKYSFFEEDEND